MGAAPGIGVLVRDPEPDKEARFRPPIKERAEGVQKRAGTKERYKSLWNIAIGSRGFRGHHKDLAPRRVFARCGSTAASLRCSNAQARVVARRAPVSVKGLATPALGRGR